MDAQERRIHRLLKQLARQRVAVMVGDLKAVELAPPDYDGIVEDLYTCHLRGWVEVAERGVPHGMLDANDSVAVNNPTSQFTHVRDVYRLTEAGWAEIRRTHAWVVASTLFALGALVASIFAIVLE